MLDFSAENSDLLDPVFFQRIQACRYVFEGSENCFGLFFGYYYGFGPKSKTSLELLRIHGISIVGWATLVRRRALQVDC